jgi:pimeloyl-ACP methyl ester carboxylesterase
MTTTTHEIDSGGVRLHVVEAGPGATSDGETVLLLHGWPDTSELWRHQVRELAAAGHRVIAPDQRGFGRSDRPEGVEAYNLLHPIQDAVVVLDGLGAGAVHVVGHDWGAAVAWGLAAAVPDRVLTLTAISLGHPSAFRAAGIEQRRRSWYVLLFQLAGIAERWLADNDRENLRAFLDGSPDVEQQIADLSELGALTASLAWYRANLPPESLVEPGLALPPVACPTLGIIGADDPYLGVDQMQRSEAMVSSEWRFECLPGVGHWVPTEVPDHLGALLSDWVAAHPSTRGNHEPVMSEQSS